ncbi:hypothetical protein WICPIJ_004179 [Wickerhamomyces pijperi]|uniref:Uncharacterized protein n=1 Tax=Wickerhamomyces pijperi TaxID=599730 RepID=A0A9P8TN01_WICPI|nr:hypothetical protein WICPIJ_004179 [Wickerhamomyces pijperi]
MNIGKHRDDSTDEFSTILRLSSSCVTRICVSKELALMRNRDCLRYKIEVNLKVLNSFSWTFRSSLLKLDRSPSSGSQFSILFSKSLIWSRSLAL